MNESNRSILAAALKKMLLIFGVAVISLFGGIVGGILPALILLPICALFSHNDPAVGMMVSVIAIPFFYIGAPIGFMLAWKWSWEHQVTKSTMESPPAFPVIQCEQPPTSNVQRSTPKSRPLVPALYRHADCSRRSTGRESHQHGQDARGTGER